MFLGVPAPVLNELRTRGFRPTRGRFARREFDNIEQEIAFDLFRHHGRRVVNVSVGIRHGPTEQALVALHHAIGVSTMGWSPAGGWLIGRSLGTAVTHDLTFMLPLRGVRGDMMSMAQALNAVAGLRSLRDVRGFYLSPASVGWRPPFLTNSLRRMIVIAFDHMNGGPSPSAAELGDLETGWRAPEAQYRAVTERWTVQAMWPLVSQAIACGQ